MPTQSGKAFATAANVCPTNGLTNLISAMMMQLSITCLVLSVMVLSLNVAGNFAPNLFK
jgi:hypothetical protein